MSLLAILGLSLSAPAVPAKSVENLAAYLSPDDYPREAIRNEEQGFVAYRLSIDADGSVSACAVEASSGSASLDVATCRILSERARFTPARDRRGRAVPDSVSGRVRWALPDKAAGSSALQDSLRAIHNVWEVTAGGRQRSCRRELVFEAGERVNVGECNPLDLKFVAAAAGYLQARPEEVLTIRLENRWLIDAALPFAPIPAHRGEILVRGEGDYRLNDDLTVRDCVEGRFSARFNWRPAPCFRKSFAEQVPAATRNLRMEVQWVVSRGPDTERPAQMPTFVSADGKMVVPLDVRPRDDKGGGANPLEGGPHQP
ncbi:energy transducer TonB [Sphingomonas sp. LHG3443-2]|uniref:energy transducer TonB n=1 Tax=Sphingomonas sp. LHG3443-2 TaxID=2804639 RepID=UPI003CF167B4